MHTMTDGRGFFVTVHIVQKGDTLWKIAKEYDVSFDQLKKMNAHLANPEYIVPGMKVNVPTEQKKKNPSISLDESKRTEPQKNDKTVVPTKEKVPPLPEIPKRSPEVETEKKQPEIGQSKDRPQTPQAEPQAPPVQLPQGGYSVPPQAIPVQPIQIIGIPCGWMPIYDPDCSKAFPMPPMHEAFPHTRHMQHHQKEYHRERSKSTKKQKTSPQQPIERERTENIQPFLQTPLYTPQQEQQSKVESKQTTVRPMPQHQQPTQKVPEPQKSVPLQQSFSTPKEQSLTAQAQYEKQVVPPQAYAPQQQAGMYQQPYISNIPFNHSNGFPQHNPTHCAYCQQPYMPQPYVMPYATQYPYWPSRP